MLIHDAVGIHRHRSTDLVDRVGKQVTHHIIVNPLAHRVLAAGHDDGVRALALVLHVDVGDEPSRVAIRRRIVVYVHDGTVVVQFEQLPRAAVMIRGPAPIKNV